MRGSREPFAVALPDKLVSEITSMTRWRFKLQDGEQADSESDEIELLLYGGIGDDQLGDAVSSQEVVQAIRSAGNRSLTVRINSPGGYAFDGIAIYNALISHPGKVRVIIDGLAASAASIIAMGGDRVAMHENAMIMIHNSWGIAIGDKHTASDLANALTQIDEQLARIYAAKARRRPETFMKMMDARPDGTRLTAQAALEERLIDEIIPLRHEPAARADERRRLAALARQRWLLLAGLKQA